MRKAIIYLMVLATFFILAGNARADVIVDTGWTPSSKPSSLLYGTQWLAAEFTTYKDWNVHEMQGYIDTYFNSGVITVQIFPVDDLGGTPLITRTFPSENVSNVNWQGTSGNTDLLKAGTYWIAFEVLNSSSFNGFMGNTLSPPPGQLSPEAYNFNNEGWKIRTLGLGVRIMGDPISPNLPVTRWWVGPNPNSLWSNPQNWSFDRNGPGGAGQPVAGDFVQVQTTTANKTVTYNSTLNPLLGEVRIDGIGGYTLTFNQSQYALSVAGWESVGFFGNGIYNQSGGSNTAGSMFVGLNPASKGTYNKSGGSLSVGDYLDIGHYGTGTFNQSGGPVTVGGELTLGYKGFSSPAGSGTYKLSGGTLSVGTDETVGYGGIGKFTQAAGTHTVGGSLYVGRNAGSSGAFTLSGGSLQVTGDEIVGDSGIGTFTQSGGTNSAPISSLTLGNSTGSSGTYSLAGGALSPYFELIGKGGTGAFTQTGGTNTNNYLMVGYFTGSSGSYTLNGGLLSSTGQIIGNGGNAIFTQNGGNNTVDMQLSLAAGGSGTYNLNSGRLQAATEIIGSYNTGIFNQKGGSNSASATLYLGDGNTGIYNLNNGTLEAGDEYIGHQDTGIFTQNGGVHTVNNLLSLGVSSAWVAQGSYNLTNGRLTVSGDERVGDGGTGTFTQTGGIHAVGNSLFLGYNGASTTFPTIGSGTYNLKGGVLTVSGNETIGYKGNGIFNQTGGSHVVKGYLMLGWDWNASGAYTMTNSSLSVTGDEFIGYGGTGIFTQNGGANTARTIYLAVFPGGNYGTYNLNSGTVTATSSALDAIHINGPYSGTIPSTTGGNFNVTGKSTVNGNMTNDGLVKTSNAQVTWNGTFTNKSAYISDPSTQTFNQDLVVTSTGYLKGLTSQDMFVFKNNFQNNSTQNTLWNTANAAMKFITGTDNVHGLYISGQGATGTNNFSWYTLDIAGQKLYLKDGNATANGDQWLMVLTGATYTSKGENASLTNIFNADPTNVLNLYYDKNLAANAYLGGFDYVITGGAGGHLYAHTPLPPSVLLLGSGLLGLGAIGWRRKRV